MRKRSKNHHVNVGRRALGRTKVISKLVERNGSNHFIAYLFNPSSAIIVRESGNTIKQKIGIPVSVRTHAIRQSHCKSLASLADEGRGRLVQLLFFHSRLAGIPNGTRLAVPVPFRRPTHSTR